MRSAWTISPASCCAPCCGPSLHDGVDERHRRRILHRLPEVQLLLEEAGVVLAAGVLDAVVRWGRASGRSPGRGSRRGRRGRRPASAAGTSAPPPGSPRSPRPTSAEITPTSVTRGKSWPLAIICVPTRTSSSRAANFARSAAIAPRLRIVSRSTRATRAPGNRSRTSASTRSVPKPTSSMNLPAQLAQTFGSGDRVVAVVAARAVRRAVHGQRQAAVRTLERRAALPAEDRAGESPPVEEHDRLLAARQRLAERVAQRARSARHPGPRPRTPRACRRSGRRPADDRARAGSSVTSVYRPFCAFW